jgi:hypothetical protein
MATTRRCGIKRFESDKAEYLVFSVTLSGILSRLIFSGGRLMSTNPPFAAIDLSQREWNATPLLGEKWLPE